MAATSQAVEAMIEVLDPTASPSASRREIAPRIRSLKGAKVGLQDNSKPNADRFLDRLEELLKEQAGVGEVVRRRKPTPSAPSEFTQELAQSCGLVINAYGD